MTAKRLIPVLAAASALAVAGCGSSDDNSSSSTSTPAASSSSTTAAATPAASGKGVDISMKNIAFDPQSVTAKVGQTVTWTNDDSVDHNVVATAGESFKSSNFGQGGTYAYKLDKPGTIKYVCTLHPGMDGTIIAK
jgi:plastocyanin